MVAREEKVPAGQGEHSVALEASTKVPPLQEVVPMDRQVEEPAAE